MILPHPRLNLSTAGTSTPCHRRPLMNAPAAVQAAKMSNFRRKMTFAPTYARWLQTWKSAAKMAEWCVARYKPCEFTLFTLTKKKIRPAGAPSWGTFQRHFASALKGPLRDSASRNRTKFSSALTFWFTSIKLRKKTPPALQICHMMMRKRLNLFIWTPICPKSSSHFSRTSL